jgi:CBS domain-containing membrane protein
MPVDHRVVAEQQGGAVMRHIRIDPAEGPSEKRSPCGNGVCVRERMSRHVITVVAGTPVAEAQRLMTAHRVHYLPVLDDRAALIGIVDADDLQKARRRRGPDAVGAVMSAPVVSIGPTAPLGEAIRLMAGRGIGALPVVARGRVVGILTQSDVVAAVARRE